jgi:hypothetical protein
VQEDVNTYSTVVKKAVGELTTVVDAMLTLGMAGTPIIEAISEASTSDRRRPSAAIKNAILVGDHDGVPVVSVQTVRRMAESAVKAGDLERLQKFQSLVEKGIIRVESGR